MHHVIATLSAVTLTVTVQAGAGGAERSYDFSGKISFNQEETIKEIWATAK
jgi:hypothetical protein